MPAINWAFSNMDDAGDELLPMQDFVTGNIFFTDI